MQHDRTLLRLVLVGLWLTAAVGAEANPYCVSGADNRPGATLEKLGMPAESRGYIWDQLMPLNPVQMVRPVRYWQYVGSWNWQNHFWGYLHESDEILDATKFSQWVYDYPGKTWIIGNEPNLMSQDGMSTEQYARMFHKYHTFILERDPTARFAGAACAMDVHAPAVENVKNWWTQVIAAYKAQTGAATMPIDIWNFHLYTPPWLTDVTSVMDIGVRPFTEFVQTVEGGLYADCPLWCTEFGIAGWAGASNLHWSQTYMNNICRTWERESEIDRWFWFYGPWDWTPTGDWEYTCLLGPDGKPSSLGQHYVSMAHGWPNDASPMLDLPQLQPAPPVFADDFDAGLRSEWIIKAGDWVAEASACRQVGLPAWNGHSLTVPYDYAGCRLGVDIHINDAASPANWAGITLRKSNMFHGPAQSGYLIYLRANGEVGLFRSGPGTIATNSALLSSATDGWHRLEVMVVNHDFTITLDGQPAIQYSDSGSPFNSGWVALEINKTDTTFDNVLIEQVIPPTLTPTLTPSLTATPPPCGLTECFDRMPAWASTAGAGVDWSIVPGGQEVYCLRAALTGNASAARGITVPVTPGRAYDISIAMHAGAAYWTCYWTETLWCNGTVAVPDNPLGSAPGWNRVAKFDGYCGGQPDLDTGWSLYHARNIVPASDTITIALTAGGLNNTLPLEFFWDNLNIIPAGSTPSPTPSVTPRWPDVNQDGRIDEQDLFEFSQDWQDQQETEFGQ